MTLAAQIVRGIALANGKRRRVPWPDARACEVAGLRVVSPNKREMPRTKARRVLEERRRVGNVLLSSFGASPPALPIDVTLIRVGPGTMDDDNLSTALKACRDEVACWACVDDGDRSKIRFHYEQRKGLSYSVGIIIAPRRVTEMVIVNYADLVERVERVEELMVKLASSVVWKELDFDHYEPTVDRARVLLRRLCADVAARAEESAR